MEKDLKILKALESLTEENILTRTQANMYWQKYQDKVIKEEAEKLNRLNP